MRSRVIGITIWETNKKFDCNSHHEKADNFEVIKIRHDQYRHFIGLYTCTRRIHCSYGLYTLMIKTVSLTIHSFMQSFYSPSIDRYSNWYMYIVWDIQYVVFDNVVQSYYTFWNICSTCFLFSKTFTVKMSEFASVSSENKTVYPLRIQKS